MIKLSLSVSYPLFRMIEAGELSCKQFEQRVLRLTSKIDRIEKGTVAAQRNLLRTLSKDITRAIVAADSETLSRGDVENAIDAAIDRFSTARRRVAQGGVQDAVDAAAEFRQALAKIGGQKVSVAPVSGNIAADIFEIQGEAAQAFADDLRARVKLEVLDGVVKGKTPKEIAAELVSKRIFTPNRASGDPSARGALAQVEKLARTEIRQVFNAASFSSGRAEQGDRPGVLKTWITQMDARVRSTHVRAGAIYGIGSNRKDSRGRSGPIRLREKFEVGDEMLRFPADPAGAPEETVNCRCVSAEILPEVAEQIDCP